MLLKDARQAVKRLQEGGVPEEQANAIVDLFVDADEQIATQQGLNDLDAKIDGVEQRLSARIDEVEQRLDAKIDGEIQRLSQQMEVQEERLTRKIQNTETRLLRWTVGLFTALAALLTIFEFVL